MRSKNPARFRNLPWCPRNLPKRFRSQLKLQLPLLLLQKVSNLMFKSVNSYPLLNSHIIWTLFIIRSHSAHSALAKETPSLELWLPRGWVVLG